MGNIFFILLILFLPCFTAESTTVTFQEGVSSYAGTQDATINTANTNEHTTDVLNTRPDAGRYYIICWDISSAAIPSTATINSATGQWYMDEQNCTSETVEAHQIEDPNNSNPIVSNSAEADIFNLYSTYRFKNETGSVKWEAAGGDASFADVDDNASAGSVASGACPGSVAKTITFTSIVSNVVSNSKSNVCLWLGINDGSGNVKIKSKRTVTSSERPLLTIDYTAAVASSNDLKVNTDLKINSDFKM